MCQITCHNRYENLSRFYGVITREVFIFLFKFLYLFKKYIGIKFFYLLPDFMIEVIINLC